MTETLLEVTGLSTHFKTRRGTVVAVNDFPFSLAVGETLERGHQDRRRPGRSSVEVRGLE